MAARRRTPSNHLTSPRPFCLFWQRVNLSSPQPRKTLSPFPRILKPRVIKDVRVWSRSFLKPRDATVAGASPHAQPCQHLKNENMKSHPHQPPSPPLSVPVRRVAPLLLLLVATACSAPYPVSAFTQTDELSALILLRDALRARGGGDAATATWICDDTSCDPCGDADGDGWGNWHYIGCRQQDGAPEGLVTRFHPTGTAKGVSASHETWVKKPKPTHTKN